MTAPSRHQGGDATRVQSTGTVGTIWRVAVTVGGLALVGVAVGGLLANWADTNPGNLVAVLVIGTLAHDLVLAPAVLAVGLLVAVLFPPPYRAILGAAALSSALVVLVTYPLWSGGGRKPDNPSASPLPYGRNLAIVCGAIWTLALIGCAVAWGRDRRQSRQRQ